MSKKLLFIRLILRISISMGGQWHTQDFPEEGRQPSGAQGYDFIKISQKLMKLKKIWSWGGGGGERPLRPLRSATGGVERF